MDSYSSNMVEEEMDESLLDNDDDNSMGTGKEDVVSNVTDALQSISTPGSSNSASSLRKMPKKVTAPLAPCLRFLCEMSQ